MSAAEQAAAVRRGAGLFALEARGLLAVSGGDRVRWLDGMVSNDVAGLAPGPERSGCYAALLTPQGRIVADLHVLLRPAELWIETASEAAGPVRARLERYVIADDVQLADRSAALGRLGLEGPEAPAILAAAGGDPDLAPDACGEVRIAAAEVVVAAFGWSGEPAFQLFTPPGVRDAVAEALLAAAPGLLRADAETLEILRIEAGVPRLGSELDETVLPDEARLERAVSRTKGCYTGQEVVARMASRGRVGHRLVGLRFADGEPPAAEEPVLAAARRVGEVTSACRSPALGAIALAYVRRPHDEPGGELSVAGRAARVCALPFAAR